MCYRKKVSHHPKRVKIKDLIPRKTLGAIDIHFHGAFGIDLMSATAPELDFLSHQLWAHGIAGFCPTTLSAPFEILSDTVHRLGKWIRKGKFPGAKPIGIHLEGPFIHPTLCGAHPQKEIRAFDWKELLQLWTASQETLKMITIAPETLSTAQSIRLSQWAEEKKIHLSIGHSQATEKQAELAFQTGFKGVTHAWNALPFHHRNPGVMGAALGKKEIYLELILDQIHVSAT